MKWMLTQAAMVMVCGLISIDVSAGGSTTTATGNGGKSGGTTMRVYETRRYPRSWTRGRWVRINGQWTYIPGTPVFETRKFGTEMKIGNVAVTDHGISFNIELKKVDPLDTLMTDGGQEVFLYRSKLHLINGKEHRILGKKDGRAYLRNVKTRHIVSAPLADRKKKDSKAGTDKKPAKKD